MASPDSFTRPTYSGFCPACGIHMHAYYQLVRRSGVLYCQGCDPDPKPMLCERCGVVTTEIAVCDPCYQALHAFIFLFRGLQSPSNEIPTGFLR